MFAIPTRKGNFVDPVLRMLGWTKQETLWETKIAWSARLANGKTKDLLLYLNVILIRTVRQLSKQ